MIAIFSQGFTIKPQTITLEPQTPQPDFKAAHNHIATHLQEGDVLIVGNTVPARIYNNTPNYWLRYSLTGKTTTATTDRFTGIPAIYEPEQLKQIESTTTGTVWIVIDQLAATRIPKEMYTTIQEEYEINWSKRNNAWSAIWIAKSK